MLNLSIIGNACFAAFFRTNLLTAGVAFSSKVFAIGAPNVFTVNAVTAQVPLAAELTTTIAGLEPEDRTLRSSLPRFWFCAMAPTEKSMSAHRGSKDLRDFFIGIVV